MQIYDNAARPSKPTYSGQNEHGTSYLYADISNKPTTIYESSQTWNYDRPVHTNRPSVYHPLQLDYPQDEYDVAYPDVSGIHTPNEDVSNSVDYSKYRGNPHEVAPIKSFAPISYSPTSDRHLKKSVKYFILLISFFFFKLELFTKFLAMLWRI